MSSIKDKLYNYEQIPPARAWDKIAAALDESNISNQFPSTLYNAEVAPPAGTWNKITAALEPATRVVQMPAKRSPFLRYAVAACVVGLVAIGILMYSGTLGGSKSGNDDELVTTGTGTDIEEPKQIPNQNNLPSRQNDTSISITSEQPVLADLPKEQNGPARKNRNNARVHPDAGRMDAVYAYNEHIPADNYVLLMTPNGFVRMSKKLGDIVCCVAGEVEDDDCKDQLKKWQQKMATSTVAPGNVMDILTLVSTLNDTDL